MTAYPADFRCAQISPYTLTVDMGVLRTPMDGGNARQRRLYRTMPTVYALEFVMTVTELGAWQEWVNDNAYDYFVIDNLESYKSGKLGKIASPHLIRFISNLSIDNPVYGWVRVKVSAEGGSIADNPELNWIIAGTPAAPSAGQAPVSFSFMVPGSLPAGATLTRSTVGGRITSAGDYASTAIDVARWTYSATTLALLGLLNEPIATNSLPNTAGTGVVAGSPGTVPTSWNVANAPAGCTRTVGIGGTDHGAPYWTVRYAGTPGAGGSLTINSTVSTAINAALGETWQASWLVGLEPGSSMANVTARIELAERDAAGAQLVATTAAIVPTTAALPAQRTNTSRTFNQATVGKATTSVRLTYTTAAIDVTLRIGLPQLVKAAAQGSMIATTAGAVTRQPDVLTVPLTDGTYLMSIARFAGTTDVAGAVVTGGAYAVPTDFSPLQSLTASKTGPAVWIIAGTPAAPSDDTIAGGTPATWNL